MNYETSEFCHRTVTNVATALSGIAAAMTIDRPTLLAVDDLRSARAALSNAMVSLTDAINRLEEVK